MQDYERILEYRKLVVKAKRWSRLDKNKSRGQLSIFDPATGLDISRRITERQKELSIFGGGIGILSKAEKTPILLYAPRVQERFGISSKIKGYEFLNTPYSVKNARSGDIELSYFVDLLYFISRETPQPEYLTKIALDGRDPFEYPFQHKLREEYEFLHCSSGEILFFCLIWRLILDLGIQQSRFDIEYAWDLFDFDRKVESAAWLTSLPHNEGLVESLLTTFLMDWEKTIGNPDWEVIDAGISEAKKQIESSIKSVSSIDDIFEQLGLFSAESLREINKYVAFIFDNRVENLTKSNARSWARAVIDELLKKFDSGSITISSILQKLHQAARFPILPYYFLIKFDDKHELKEHVVFPLWYTFAKDTNYEFGPPEARETESATLHALYTISPVWKTKGVDSNIRWYTEGADTSLAELHPFFRGYLGRLFSFFSALTKPIVDIEYYARQRTYDIGLITRQAARAAISQVMARNMSHNIGSHVLSKFKSRDQMDTENNKGRYSKSENEGAGNQYKDTVQTNGKIRGLHHGLYTGKDTSRYSSEKGELENNNQLAYFNEYLKNRMDFLADIATAEPVLENSMYLYSEVFKGLDRNRILLNRISGISDTKFNFSIDIKRRILKDDDGLVDLHRRDHRDSPNATYDIPIAMTNDILGAQAFYIIIENIIRNIAKHGNAVKKEKEDVRITIEIADYQDPTYYEVQIYDNLLRPQNRINDTVFKRNTAFNSSILDTQAHALRSSDLGTIEMDVCAAYLRRVPILSIEEDKFKLFFVGMKCDSSEDKSRLKELTDMRDPHSCNAYKGEILNDVKRDEKHKTEFPKLMFAFRKEHLTNGRNRFSLGYKFYLKKPQEVLLVTENDGKIPTILPEGAENVPKELRAHGIQVITIDELSKQLAKARQVGLDLVFNHQIVYNTAGKKFTQLFNTKDENGEFRYRPLLPKRIANKLKSESFDGADDFVRQVWEKYVTGEVLKKRKKISLLGGGDIRTLESCGDGLVVKTTASKITGTTRVYIGPHDEGWCSECCPVGRIPSTEHKDTHKDPSKSPWEWDYFDMSCHHSTVARSDYQSALFMESDPKTKGETKRVGWFWSQYIETVLTKIIVLDERIQENISNEEVPKLYSSDKLNFHEYFRKQQIIIPLLPKKSSVSSDPNLNESTFGILTAKHTENSHQVSGKIKKFISDQISEARFCVIHLGVLEKLLPPDSSKSAEDIASVLQNLRPNRGWGSCEVIITSGRGEPANIPPGYSFVPLAPIQNALETVFDKTILTKLLFNAREIRRR